MARTSRGPQRGAALHELGRPDEAVACYRRALALRPDAPEVCTNLGNALADQGRLDEAVACHRNAITLRPGYLNAHCNLGNALREQGRLDEALASYRRAIAIRPDHAAAHSDLLCTLNYLGTVPPAVTREEACRFGRMVAAKATPFAAWTAAATPERLRVGLVSGDLRRHPVGYFIEGLLAAIDPGRVEVFAYPTRNNPDDLTRRLRPHFAAWTCLDGLSDAAAARRIHADGVHILIDLSGHTAHNRLPVFAWRPAPVQATWLGYFATTGLAAIDHVLADPHVVPPGEEDHFTEGVWRLPESYLCFTPPDVALEVARLPALSSGAVTFGCFNNLAKMNDAVVALWARVVLAVPGSRLFLKTRQLDDRAVGEATRRRFAAFGLAVDRLVLEGASPRSELLKAYDRVDIALDPFPYPGGTTTVEALWMGVPTVTRRGDRFLAHIGESIAHNAGLGDWIAADDDDYVAKAVAHAADLGRLAGLRAGLRRQVLASPLFDAPRFARHFEAALWEMWENRIAMRDGSGANGG